MSTITAGAKNFGFIKLNFCLRESGFKVSFLIGTKIISTLLKHSLQNLNQLIIFGFHLIELYLNYNYLFSLDYFT
jgi:uncharacterized membrane protein YciS (DUF1049 family)